MKTIGYVIVMDSHPVRHIDSDPYWLQWSAFCELYQTYEAARRDVRKELRTLQRAKAGKWVPQSTVQRWIDSLRIIPVKR